MSLISSTGSFPNAFSTSPYCKCSVTSKIPNKSLFLVTLPSAATPGDFDRQGSRLLVQGHDEVGVGRTHTIQMQGFERAVRVRQIVHTYLRHVASRCSHCFLQRFTSVITLTTTLVLRVVIYYAATMFVFQYLAKFIRQFAPRNSLPQVRIDNARRNM